MLVREMTSANREAELIRTRENFLFFQSEIRTVSQVEQIQLL